jgi:hypothetical protein
MNYEKLREYWILLVLWILWAVAIFTIFSDNSDFQKWISLRTQLWTSIVKWTWELWKYDKNIVSYISENNVFSKTFWNYTIKTLKTNTNKEVIPMFIWWIWDASWESLLFTDESLNNILNINWVSDSVPAFANEKLYELSVENTSLFPFLITKWTKIPTECKNDLITYWSNVWWKSILVWLFADANRSSTESWDCKVETQYWINNSASDCEEKCKRNLLSNDFFWYVTQWYFGLWFFKSIEEATKFDEQYFWWDWLILNIEWENWKLYVSLLERIWL